MERFAWFIGTLFMIGLCALVIQWMMGPMGTAGGVIASLPNITDFNLALYQIAPIAIPIILVGATIYFYVQGTRNGQGR